MSRLYRMIVPVPDVHQAVAFYRALLGQEGERIDSTRYYFGCGSVILAVVHPGEHGRSFRPNPEVVYFAEVDLEASFARAQAAGAKPLTDDDVGWGIQARPWGERSFYVSDPFGNPLCFVDEATLFTGSAKVA